MRNPLTIEQFLEKTNAKRLGYTKYRDLWYNVTMEGGDGLTTEGRLKVAAIVDLSSKQDIIIRTSSCERVKNCDTDTVHKREKIEAIYGRG